VELQQKDEHSILNLTRTLLAFRRATVAVQLGGYVALPSPLGTWVYRRGDAITVALNLSDAKTTVDCGDGSVVLGTERSRGGEVVSGRLDLRPWEGVIVSAEPTPASRQ
jgi:glycosidase